MVLTIDVGNSNIVVGVYQKEKLILTLRTKTDTTKTEDEYLVLFDSTFRVNHVDPGEIDGAVISSVVPALSSILSLTVKKMIGCMPLIVGPGTKTGLSIKVDNPAELGSDLVVGAVGALTKYDPPLILIDMGTATTVFAVNKNREFIGGSIMPGIRVSLEGLTSHAAQLSQIGLSAPKHAIGTNTSDCLRSGIILGCADMLDGMCRRFMTELGGHATVIATGGLSEKVLPYCSTDIIFEANLIPMGLLEIYNKNK